MMDKLIRCDNDETKILEEKFGFSHFNQAPANFKEVDEEWLARHSTFRTYGFRYHWYQQIMNLPDEKYTLSIHCFGSEDGTGFAISTNYWAGKIRYFSFAGCEHEFRTPTREECAEHHDYPGNCYHVYICDKCGYWYSVDSSD